MRFGRPIRGCQAPHASAGGRHPVEHREWLPAPLSVDVIGPGSAPMPSGTVTSFAGGRMVLTRPVGSTTDLAVTASTLAALGRDVTISYSGDEFYEPGEAVRVARTAAAARRTARPPR